MTQKVKIFNVDSGVKNILYIGEDINFWENIKSSFEKNYSLNNFLYYQYETDSKLGYKLFFKKAYKFRPCIIYLDLSKDTVKLLKLARLLTREVKFKNSIIVGLVENKRGAFEALAANCDFVFIKSGEIHDVVYGPVRLLLPQIAKEPQFARAITEENFDVLYSARVGYMTKDYIHVECDYPLAKDKEYKISTGLPKNTLTSDKFTILEDTTSKGNYYSHQYSFNLRPNFVDRPELLNEVDKLKALGKKVITDQDTIEITKKEYEANLEKCKSKFDKFITERIEDGFDKKLRILISDDNYSVLDQTEDDLSSFPFAFRLTSGFDEDFSEISRIKPNIIAIQLGEDKVEESEQETPIIVVEESEEEENSENEKKLKNKKDSSKNKKQWIENLEEEQKKEKEKKDKSKILNFIKSIVSYVKELEDYSPVLIFFNSNYSSKNIQNFGGYELAICNKEPINLKTICEMAEVLEKRMLKDLEDKLELKVKEMKSSDEARYKKLKPSDVMEKRFYISKRSPLSEIKIQNKVTIIGLSESEIWFKCEEKLEFGKYEINIPENIMFTLIFDRDTGGLITNLNGENCYQGVFHCYLEDEKKEIRKKVNQIFFTDLINQRKLEEMEYEKVTKEALDKKLSELEEMKRLLEMAEVKKSSSG